MQIGSTNIGLDQFKIPAPLLYRRICNAYIMIIAPTLAGFVATLPLDPTWKHMITGGLVVFGSLVKAIEYIIGDSTYQNPNTPK